jgi:hypothetical protein
MLDDLIAGALHRFLSRSRSASPTSRRFYRISGFPDGVYGPLLDRFDRQNRLGNGSLVCRTTGPVHGHEAKHIEAGKSATWYRNNVGAHQDLVLVFNVPTSDSQSLKDVYGINDVLLMQDGRADLIAAAFSAASYELTASEQASIEEFVQAYSAHVHEPQVADLAAFFHATAVECCASGCGIATAIARALPHLGLFRCEELGSRTDVKKQRRLLRDLARAAQLGAELIDERKQREYLDLIGDADFVDGFGGLTADEKRLALRELIEGQSSSVAGPHSALHIDWSEVRGVLQSTARVPPDVQRKRLGEEIREALDADQLADEVVQEVLGALDSGEQPSEQAVQSLLEEHRDSLPTSVERILQRAVKRLHRRTRDFVEGVFASILECTELLGHAQGEGVEVTVSAALGASGKNDQNRIAQRCADFVVLHGGIENRIPYIDWHIKDVYKRAKNAAGPDAEAEREGGSLAFKIQVTTPGGSRVESRIEWLHDAECPAALLRQEFSSLADEYASGEPFIPVYTETPGTSSLRYADIRKPFESFGYWFRSASRLDEQIAKLGEQYLDIPSDILEAVAREMERCAREYAQFVRKALQRGVLDVNISGVLDRYEDLLSTAAEKVTTEQEARIFACLSAAWIVAAAERDDWALAPLSHPLKLLWWVNRTDQLGDLVRRRVHPSESRQVADQDRFLREIRETYGSGHWPAVVTLPRGDTRHYYVPHEEHLGYELYRHMHLAGTVTGDSGPSESRTVDGDHDTSGNEASSAASVIAPVLMDYLKTFPFARDGLDVCLVDCNSTAIARSIVERLCVSADDGGINLNLTVHTETGGSALYTGISTWLASDEAPAITRPGDYFPDVQVTVRECPVAQLATEMRDHDVAILVDTFGAEGETITIEEEPAALDANSSMEDYFPLHRSREKPLGKGDLTRRVELNPGTQPDLLRHYYGVQAAAYRRRPITDVRSEVRYNRTARLDTWETRLNSLHEAFNWVVCYDTAVTRRLLQTTASVKVVRYAAGVGPKRQHNLTCSTSDRSLQIVTNRLATRLGAMLRQPADSMRTLSQSLVREAYELSGDIVLRAAGPGSELNELIGLVVARRLSEQELPDGGPDSVTAWIRLDDYQHWFDRGKYPDLMSVTITLDSDGAPSLRFNVIEVKCVGHASARTEEADAVRQLERGLSRLWTAFHPDAVHLDADFWYDQLYSSVLANLPPEDADCPAVEQLWRSLERGKFIRQMSAEAWVFCHDGKGQATDSRSETVTRPCALDGIPSMDISVRRFTALGLGLSLVAVAVEHGDDAAWAPTEQPAASGEDPLAQKHAEPADDAPDVGASVSPDDTGALADELGDRTAEQPAELDPPLDSVDEDSELDGTDELNATAHRLTETLRQYRIRTYAVDPQDADVGPRLVRYKIRLEPGEQLKNIQRYGEDLQREMELPHVPLIENVPGTRYVGIDIARQSPVTVEFADVLEELPEAGIGSLPLLIGQTPDGQVVVRDLADLPHLLIGGTTGSGKTVFLHTVMASLLAHRSSSDLSLMIVDPKQTDFAFFDGLRQLHGGRVLTDPEEAVECLRDLNATERERRTAAIRGKAKNLREYNELHPDDAIQPIVVIVDEYADLVDIMGKSERQQFELEIKRLAQSARSVGIHLVVATQRPSADIVPSSLKAVLPARIAFRLPAGHDSITILDTPGAERLLGNGDMLCRFGDSITRLQGFHLHPSELANPAGLARKG